MDTDSPILAPVIALVLWSVVMWLWMYATRIPAMQKAQIDFDRDVYTTDDLKKLPLRTQWKADNYNHLMEQPTIFYATALTLAILGAGDGLNLTLAWAYVALRIAHSIFQAAINFVPVRFAIYALGNIPLIWLAVNAALSVF